jgi:hypothetical protein
MDPTASAPDRTVKRRLHGRGSGNFPIVRRAAVIALALAATGCGTEEQRENLPRPAPPVTMTAAVQDGVIRVSPRAVGAGRIVLVVANMSDSPQRVTFETDELGGQSGGNRASSPVIPPRGTGRLAINARQGAYSVHVADDSVRPARVVIGPPRESGQDQLLLP